jgi:hypothetical protein
MAELKIERLSPIEPTTKVAAKGDRESFTKALLSNLESDDLALLNDKIEPKVQAPSRLDLTDLSSDSPEKFMRSNINFV